VQPFKERQRSFAGTRIENRKQQRRSSGFKPYVPDKKDTGIHVQAILLGFILSIVFNAANAYLGLKIA